MIFCNDHSDDGNIGCQIPPQKRPAISGMLEILILTGIAVVVISIFAVWFSGWGTGETGSGSTLFSPARCTIHITLFEDVGGTSGGNKTFVSVDATNTGSRNIDVLQITAGSNTPINATTNLRAGQIFGGYETVTDSVDARALEATAAYADGDVILCDRRWSTGAAG